MNVCDDYYVVRFPIVVSRVSVVSCSMMEVNSRAESFEEKENANTKIKEFKMKVRTIFSTQCPVFNGLT